MPAVMTTGGEIGCATKGKATLVSTAKLKAGGNPVLLSITASTWVIAGCKNGTTPCTAVAKVNSGEAGKLKVGGSPVVLVGAVVATNGTDSTAIASDAGQSKLSAK